MAIPSTGSISLQTIADEFGGTTPHSLDEYYRGGANVPGVGAGTDGIPTTGAINFDQFRGTSKTATVTYELIGGGGAGGHGVGDKGEELRGTYGDAGESSSISASGITTITAAGGAGGENCGGERGQTGFAGASTVYGAGGAGGALNSSGQPAPTASYGAGGGGGGGDDGGYNDSGGCSGEGGKAGTRKTGTFSVVYGTVITVKAGAGGVTNTPGYDGGAGATGYIKLSWDAKTSATTSANTTITIN